MTNLSRLIALAGAALIAAPAGASEWPSSGNFHVIELAETCAIVGSFTFDGRPDVEFHLIADDALVSIAFTSLAWSRPSDDVEMSYGFFPTNGPSTSAYKGRAHGITLDRVHNGFSASFEPSVLDAFASSASLAVAKGDTTVTHINLRGSAASVSTLQRCNAAVKRRLDGERRAEAKWDYISQDPFAAPTSGSDDPWKPTWTAPPRVIADDYPAIGDVARDGGSATVECDDRENGSPAACTVVSETAPGLGDAAVKVVMRARVVPRGVGFRWTVDFPPL